MPTPITPTGPTPVSTAVGATSTPTSTNQRPDVLGKDAFLKLLVAQLRYQDPSNPTDSSQFMSQTAQFTQVEKLEEIAKSTTEMLSAQSMLATSALVGRTVTYTGADGAEASGVVASASFGATGSTVRLADGTDVPVGSVTQVRATATSTA
jgi:flagellar basal-body rod modification protein FlgD